MTVLADAYDAFLFDLDGVLYRGSEVVPGAPEAIARLRAADKHVAFVTNNSGRTPDAVAGLLNGFGIAPRASRLRPRRWSRRTNWPRAASPRRSSWERRASSPPCETRGSRWPAPEPTGRRPSWSDGIVRWTTRSSAGHRSWCSAGRSCSRTPTRPTPRPTGTGPEPARLAAIETTTGARGVPAKRAPIMLAALERARRTPRSDRGSYRDGYRRRSRAWLGFAPRPHRHHPARGPPRLPHRADVRR